MNYKYINKNINNVYMRGFNPLNMILCEGAVEILEYAKDGKPKHFNGFRELINPRTGNPFSSKTILDRTKELVELGALKRVLTKTKNGREVAGYQITEKGSKSLELANNFEQELIDIFSIKR